jgi:hypothetical protein
MLGFGGHWWWFPGAQIGTDSEFEGRRDSVFLLEPNGGTLEGIAFAHAAQHVSTRTSLTQSIRKMGRLARGCFVCGFTSKGISSARP